MAANEVDQDPLLDPILRPFIDLVNQRKIDLEIEAFESCDDDDDDDDICKSRINKSFQAVIEFVYNIVKEKQINEPDFSFPDLVNDIVLSNKGDVGKSYEEIVSKVIPMAKTTNLLTPHTISETFTESMFCNPKLSSGETSSNLLDSSSISNTESTNTSSLDRKYLNSYVPKMGKWFIKSGEIDYNTFSNKIEPTPDTSNDLNGTTIKFVNQETKETETFIDTLKRLSLTTGPEAESVEDIFDKAKAKTNTVDELNHNLKKSNIVVQNEPKESTEWLETYKDALKHIKKNVTSNKETTTDIPNYTEKKSMAPNKPMMSDFSIYQDSPRPKRKMMNNKSSTSSTFKYLPSMKLGKTRLSNKGGIFSKRSISNDNEIVPKSRNISIKSNSKIVGAKSENEEFTFKTSSLRVPLSKIPYESKRYFPLDISPNSVIYDSNSATLSSQGNKENQPKLALPQPYSFSDQTAPTSEQSPALYQPPSYYWNILFEGTTSTKKVSNSDFHSLLYDYSRLWEAHLINQGQIGPTAKTTSRDQI